MAELEEVLEEKKDNAKKPYRRPVLNHLGTLSELTQGASGSTNDFAEGNS